MAFFFSKIRLFFFNFEKGRAGLPPLPPPPSNYASAIPKSIDLMQSTGPLFNNPLPHSTIKLWKIKTFKIGFRKLLILSKF